MHSSLDRISKDFGPVRIDVLGKIAEAMLGGLTYLYNVHRIVHRDIKPSNVLVNTRGYIKLCDFGVSGELVNSIANTFVGTSYYMAPERIRGAQYSVKSDVWSLGLTLMELAIGRFPFDSTDEAAGDRVNAGPPGILDLLQQIVHEPAPKLPKSDAFPQILEDMIQRCLMKDPNERPTPQELYVSCFVTAFLDHIQLMHCEQDNDPFLRAAKRTPVDLEGWAVSMMEKHNRQSHLVQPASSYPPNVLRGGDDSASSKETLGPITPTTSEEIFIGNVRPSPVTAVAPTSSSSSVVTPKGENAPNGIHNLHSGHNPHPGHPLRTSSASAVPGLRAVRNSAVPSTTTMVPPPSIPGTRPSPGATSTQTVTLPMRPAPPIGPLPPAPNRWSRKSAYQSVETAE